ncbi:MAG TPA: response regulator [Thermoanaerobaculia bacterium]|nr:response regulator [Thermoanaerobaculia bacterium]
MTKRVLVVDDDATIRELLTSVVRRRGLIVDEAADGAEALDLLRQNIYSVVLLDLLMPNTDGFAVLRELDAALAPPVVLVITGADRSLVKQLDPQRIHGVVRKPFDADDLANLVVACAEIKSRRGFETMAISAIMAGGPLLAWLNRFGG